MFLGKKKGLNCLKGDVLPMNRVYSFDNGNCRLEFTASAIEFTVECDVLGKFLKKNFFFGKSGRYLGRIFIDTNYPGTNWVE